jgi:hypothetical protein
MRFATNWVINAAESRAAGTRELHYLYYHIIVAQEVVRFSKLRKAHFQKVKPTKT